VGVTRHDISIAPSRDIGISDGVGPCQ
jgi:hypothetical protein